MDLNILQNVTYLARKLLCETKIIRIKKKLLEKQENVVENLGPLSISEWETIMSAEGSGFMRGCFHLLTFF